MRAVLCLGMLVTLRRLLYRCFKCLVISIICGSEGWLDNAEQSDNGTNLDINSHIMENKEKYLQPAVNSVVFCLQYLFLPSLLHPLPPLLLSQCCPLLLCVYVNLSDFTITGLCHARFMKMTDMRLVPHLYSALCATMYTEFH